MTDFHPDRVLAWNRFAWTKSEGPPIPCAKCSKPIRHGIIRQGTESLFRSLVTRSRFHIICEACYKEILHLENGDEEI
jgi:hypothetical protein